MGQALLFCKMYMWQELRDKIVASIKDFKNLSHPICYSEAANQVNVIRFAREEHFIDVEGRLTLSVNCIFLHSFSSHWSRLRWLGNTKRWCAWSPATRRWRSRGGRRAWRHWPLRTWTSRCWSGRRPACSGWTSESTWWPPSSRSSTCRRTSNSGSSHKMSESFSWDMSSSGTVRTFWIRQSQGKVYQQNWKFNHVKIWTPSVIFLPVPLSVTKRVAYRIESQWLA